MTLNTLPQTYLIPANSQALNKAVSILQALELQFERPSEINEEGGNVFFSLTVHMPFIPVVHYYNLNERRQELADKRAERVKRPSHVEARRGAYGAIEAVYPYDFFSSAQDQELATSIADLLVKEHLVQQFATQGIVIHKITFSKSASEVIGASRFFSQDEWYAMVEEARPVIADLATMIGAK